MHYRLFKDYFSMQCAFIVRLVCIRITHSPQNVTQNCLVAWTVQSRGEMVNFVSIFFTDAVPCRPRAIDLLHATDLQHGGQ